VTDRGDVGLDRSYARAALRRITTARVLLERAGLSYSTSVLLELRANHAAARDAVHSQVDLTAPAWSGLRHDGLIELRSAVGGPAEHLLRPDLGRRFDNEALERLREQATMGSDVQLVLGDGLSAEALIEQGPRLFAALIPRLTAEGWSVGRPLFVRHCRVGIINEVGRELRPTFVILLIGERPGLSGARSLSAYLAFRPTTGDTNAERNLISNIHEDGVPIDAAADRVVALLRLMQRAGGSGVRVKEDAPQPIAPGSSIFLPDTQATPRQ
jgi:ethanolamine ammonia-lyase small subunit